jgi:hypothetical protein
VVTGIEKNMQELGRKQLLIFCSSFRRNNHRLSLLLFPHSFAQKLQRTQNGMPLFEPE